MLSAGCEPAHNVREDRGLRTSALGKFAPLAAIVVVQLLVILLVPSTGHKTSDALDSGAYGAPGAPGATGAVPGADGSVGAVGAVPGAVGGGGGAATGPVAAA